MTVLVELPDDLRGELKDPLGPVFTDPGALLAHVEGPVITVGDIVTYHIERVHGAPDVSLIDERTKRGPIDPAYAVGAADVTVSNPPATLTDELLRAVRDAIRSPTPTRIFVEGEEDLAAIPAVIVAPDGASVVYGQPDEGMVLVTVTPALRERMRDFLSRMDGDTGRALALLE